MPTSLCVQLGVNRKEKRGRYGGFRRNEGRKRDGEVEVEVDAGRDEVK